jgi:aryl-alcohol dehydrogenase-like predicted oxidoreductase
VETRTLGRLGPVSALSFGGGGIGGVYGEVARDEAIATVRAAADAGITVVDLAPTYGPGEQSPEAELVVGEAFGGRLPAGVLVTSKVLVGETLPVESIPHTIRESLSESLGRLRLPHIDLFFLHSYVRPSHVQMELFDVVDVRTVREIVRPELEMLVDEGLIGDWGVTGIAHPDALCDLLEDDVKPAAIQCVTNALDSVGDMWPFDSGDHPDNARIRTAAVRNGVGVMGIRAVAAGALADGLDRTPASGDPAALDHHRAERFRSLARRWGVSAAVLAHRYALSLPGVATVIVGAKTRRELADSLEALAAGPLTAEEMRSIEVACAPHPEVRA